MGMASSIALGLALARPDLRVIVLDGDGSILMNLGSLATERATGVTNLVHIIWDNGGWEITGGQPAGSPFGVDLEAVAQGCGFSRTASVENIQGFRAALTEAMADTQAWVIVARVDAGDSPYRPSKNCVWLRDRFRTALGPAGDGQTPH
jgi:thiamine pyrophosphate-dependent acetolactate synthase large subunit-like protein